MTERKDGLGRIGAILAGCALLLTDLLILPAAPAPWQLVRYGLLGALVQPALVIAGALSLARGRESGTRTPFFHLAVLGLLLSPMVVVDDWTLPVVEIARWALSGAALAIWAATAAGVTLLALLADLLLPPGPKSFGWRSVPLAVWATAVPFLHLPWLHAAQGRMALSGLLGSAALLALAWGLRASGRRAPRGTGPTDLVVSTDALPEGSEAERGDPDPCPPRPSPVHELSGPDGWGAAAVQAVPVCLLFIIYLALKLETASYSATDENIYFYGAKLLADGRMPYKDFFFAHPPLHLLIPGFLTLLFGFDFHLLKLVPAAASMVSGLFLYLAGRRAAGPLTGLLAAALFLLAHEQLQASTNLTGVNITVAFLCAGFWAAVVDRPFLSGSMGAMAVLSGVYAAAPALALPLLLFHRTAGRGGRFAASFSLLLCGTVALFYFLFGKPFIEQVFEYHFMKPAKAEGLLAPGVIDLAALFAAGAAAMALATAAGARGGRSRKIALSVAGVLLVCSLVVPLAKGGPAGLALVWHDLRLLAENDEFLRFFFFHPHLVLAPLGAAVALPAVLAATRWLGTGGGPAGGRLRISMAGLAMSAAALVELSLLRETYSFYYVLAIPGLALLGAVSWAALFELAGTGDPECKVPSAKCKVQDGQASSLSATIRLRTTLRRGFVNHRPSRAAALLLLFLAGLWANTAPVAAGLAVGATRFPEEKAEAGEWVCYDLDRGGSGPFSALVNRYLLTTCRFRGSSEPGIYHYLWKKRWAFSRAEEIAGFIRQTSTPDETMIGSSLVAPLLALLSDRQIAAAWVDTNSKRFKSGLAAERDLWRAACATPLRYVVAGPRSFFTPERMRNHPVIRAHFQPVKVFNEPELNMEGRYPIVLYRRVDDSPLKNGAYCGY